MGKGVMIVFLFLFLNARYYGTWTDDGSDGWTDGVFYA